MELRMYGLVPYNLSPIQQSIQYGHSVVEYGLNNFHDKDYQDWAKLNKTFIILNGGTTNINYDRLGTLNKHADYLESIGVKIARFHEPDLGDQLTAICFILNEKVFNKILYPDYIPYIKNTLDNKCNRMLYCAILKGTPKKVSQLLCVSANDSLPLAT